MDKDFNFEDDDEIIQNEIAFLGVTNFELLFIIAIFVALAAFGIGVQYGIGKQQTEFKTMCLSEIHEWRAHDKLFYCVEVEKE